MEGREPITYAGAGVDIDAANRSLQAMLPFIKQTHGRHLMDRAGQPFSAPVALGLAAAGERIPIEQLMIAPSVDSAGTIPQEALLALDFFPEGLTNTGYNVTAHCCADVACGGVTPFIFLDMITSTDMRPEINALIIQGMAEACKELAVMIVGGELAQCPGTIVEGQYDVIGFAIGYGRRDAYINPKERVKPGQVIVGYHVGFHMINGSSLIRRVNAAAGLGIRDIFPPTGKTVAESLLRRQPNFAKMVGAQLAKGLYISANSHITGGGLPDNIGRNLPEGCQAVIDSTKWEIPPFFGWLIEQGVPLEEAIARLNMGIGFAQIYPTEHEARRALAIAEQLGFSGAKIGEIVAGERGVKVLR